MRNQRVFIGKSEDLLWRFYFSGGFISHLFFILICGNKTIWRLEILLRTILAALLKTKYNGRFVKNKRYQETGKDYFKIVQMILKDEGYKYFAARTIFDAWLCPLSPPSASQTHTHTNKKDTVCLVTSAHPNSSPHNLFSNSHHDERTGFLIPQLPKNKREFIP